MFRVSCYFEHRILYEISSIIPIRSVKVELYRHVSRDSAIVERVIAHSVNPPRHWLRVYSYHLPLEFFPYTRGFRVFDVAKWILICGLST